MTNFNLIRSRSELSQEDIFKFNIFYFRITLCKNNVSARAINSFIQKQTYEFYSLREYQMTIFLCILFTSILVPPQCS